MSDPDPAALADLVISGGLTWDESAPGWVERDIAVSDGRIRAIGSEVPTAHASRVLDAGNCLVLPGLVNAHTHAHNNLLKGTGDCRFLEGHINAMTAVAQWTPEDLYASTLLGAVEMLTTGTTAAHDMVRATSQEHLAAVVQAYTDSGIRVTLAPSVSDIPFAESVPGLREVLDDELRRELAAAPRPPAAERAAQYAAAAIERWDGHADGRIRIAAGPLIADVCSDVLLTELAGIALAAGAPMHMHLLESKVQALNGVARSGGETWVRHLHDLGVLGPHLTVAHAVWLTPGDVDLVATSGTTVAHSPASNAKLGSGIAPVGAYVRAGVNVAIATDGAASGDTLDMFAACWLTGLLNHVRDPDPASWLSARDVLTMATEGGALALGHGHTGRLEVGQPADVVVVDTRTPGLTPLNDPSVQLVYGGAGSCVRDVLVGGTVVVRDGSLTTVDADEALHEAREAAARLHVAAPLDGLHARLARPLGEIQSRLRAQQFEVDRYAARPDDL